MALKLFNQLVKKYITDNTVATAGMAPTGGQGGGDYNTSDTYAPGDARLPKVLGATIKRKGKVKKKQKKKLNESKSVSCRSGHWQVLNTDTLSSHQKQGLRLRRTYN